jgi:DnaJ-class molecular chaperone
VCVNCGGAGIVADMGKIERTGDPHASRRCGTCKGTGQPKSVTASPEGGPR